ncbi:MAG: diguanylate cyclase [Candidatus Eisenbacteria bacterium]|nr:diguanylate cyclase [Candidatus Eisenbacteria bacterium]
MSAGGATRVPLGCLRRNLARRRSGATLTAIVLLGLGTALSCAQPPEAKNATPRPAVASAPTLLRYETVRSILQDSKGNYWFGSWNEGVCRFDGDSLTYFTKDDGLGDNQVRSIHEDRNGVVWFECAFGLSGFDGKRIITPTSRNYTAKEQWQLQPGDLWFKEDGGAGATQAEGKPGVYRFDGKTFTYLTYPLSDDPTMTPSRATTGIAQGNPARVWFATYTSVIGYDGRSFTVIDDQSLGHTEETGWLHVRSVLEDSKGNLWIGNNGIGVIRYADGTASQFTQEHGLGKVGMHGGRGTPLPGDVTDGSPTLHRVFSMGEDRDGNIWFGTIEFGAWRYDGQTLTNYSAKDGLTSKDIMAIYTDRQGNLWVAGNGVFRFNGRSFDRVH